MKIAIINQPLANRGDEAAHKAFVRTLARRFPQCQFDVVFFGKDQNLVDSFTVQLPHVSYKNLSAPKQYVKIELLSLVLGNARFACVFPSFRKYRACLQGYDCVICAPGGICMGGFRNWDHIWQLLIAKNAQKTILYWGRSIGPFDDKTYFHTLFKRYSETLMHYFAYMSLRDVESVKIANEMGVNCVETVDSAFLEQPNASIPVTLQTLIGTSPYIIYVPNELTWHFQFSEIAQERIDDFYLAVIAQVRNLYPNYKILMLPQTYNSAINDHAYFEKLKEKSDYSNIIVVNENENSDVQQALISGAAFVIGARYHSIVFAINNDIPFISLGYEHKMKGLLEKLGLLEFYIDLKSVFLDENDGSEKALEKIQYLLKNKKSYKAKQLIHETLKNSFDALCGHIS